MKNDINALKSVFANIFYILTKKEKIGCVRILILILFGSLLETLGVSLILPFVQALLSPQSFFNNKYFSLLTNFFNIVSDKQIVYFVGGGLILIYILKNIVLLYITYEQTRFRWKMQHDLSTRMLKSYMKRPYEYFLGINSSQILRSIGDDMSSLYNVIDRIFQGISCILTIGLIGIFLCITDFQLAISVLAVSGTCFIIITLYFRKLLKGAGRLQREASIKEKTYAYQAITGIKEIYVMQRREHFIDKYKTAHMESTIENIKFNFLSACPTRIIEAVCIGGIILVVCIRYGLGEIDTTFISQMAVFVVAAMRILPLTSNLISNVNSLVYYWAGVDITFRNLQETEKYETAQNCIKAKNQNEILENLKYDLQELHLEKISWTYPGTKNKVLDDLNLIINKNQSVAFVGKSGAGKTTLSDIILGLYKPQEGTVFINNIDISTIPDIWSRMIGYVPQSIFMIDDTILANVTFGIDEKDIDINQAWRALKQAQIEEFVLSLPKGIETIVGERGVKFSGGQKQRIAIARALYYNPEILLLDEATSALDHETEKAVMESIEALQGNKTLIIIAHRLSTIEKCDKVYEITNGKAIPK